MKFDIPLNKKRKKPKMINSLSHCKYERHTIHDVTQESFAADWITSYESIYWFAVLVSLCFRIYLSVIFLCFRNHWISNVNTRTCVSVALRFPETISLFCISGVSLTGACLTRSVSSNVTRHKRMNNSQLNYLIYFTNFSHQRGAFCNVRVSMLA